MPRIQENPAEGSREVIERELARLDGAKTPAPSTVAVAARDVVRLLGDLDEARISEILALSPSISELEQAAAWLGGEGDRPDEQGHPLAGKAAAIFDIAFTPDDTELH
jgi:hypothetical protein